MDPLRVSYKGMKSSCKWKSAKEEVRIRCYLEELYPFNLMIDIDLIFTSSDFSEIPVKPLRLEDGWYTCPSLPARVKL